jgi:hypothetical protein
VTGRAAPIDAMRVAGEQALLAAAGPRTAG